MKPLLMVGWALSFGLIFQAKAETIGDFAKLNRLSQVIRGHGPTQGERAELETALRLGNGARFLETKTDEYLASDQHAFKMRVRLEELFRLKTAARLLGREGGSPSLFESEYHEKNALTYLFNEMGRQNRSWDDLLIAKDYRLFPSERFAVIQGIGVNDYGFMAALIPDLKSLSGTYSSELSHETHRDVRFNGNDPRVAGAITTSRFMTRFVTTGLNKNRKRAAEVFRVFLCDSMSAAIPSTEGKDDQIFDLMLPHDQSMTENEIRTMAQQSDSLHGSRPDCNACHFKLDPMGRTFLTSPFALSAQASPGALSFKRGQQIVKVPVKGIGELGAAITQQPEYVSCQVDHFWSWFMGSRHKLSDARRAQLSAEFDRVGRRTNDFIKILLKQPEFFELGRLMSEAEIRAQHVKTFLKKCQDCHKDQYNSNSDDGSFPDFTKWPIGGSADDMARWTRKISRAMDLAHDGESPVMPPRTAPWRTSLREVNLLKSWIADGAPDETGRRTVAP